MGLFWCPALIKAKDEKTFRPTFKFRPRNLWLTFIIIMGIGHQMVTNGGFWWWISFRILVYILNLEGHRKPCRRYLISGTKGKKSLNYPNGPPLIHNFHNDAVRSKCILQVHQRSLNRLTSERVELGISENAQLSKNGTPKKLFVFR